MNRGRAAPCSKIVICFPNSGICLNTGFNEKFLLKFFKIPAFAGMTSYFLDINHVSDKKGRFNRFIEAKQCFPFQNDSLLYIFKIRSVIPKNSAAFFHNNFSLTTLFSSSIDSISFPGMCSPRGNG